MIFCVFSDMTDRAFWLRCRPVSLLSIDSSATVFTKGNAKSAPRGPGNMDVSDVISADHFTMRSNRRRLWGVHGKKFYFAADGILPTDSLDLFFTRESHRYPPRSLLWRPSEIHASPPDFSSIAPPWPDP